MIQGGGDAGGEKDTLQQSSSNVQEQVEHTSVPEQAQVAHSHISAIHGQRISLSQPVASAVIATPIATAGVGGSSAAGTSNAAYQHYLIPGVSLGGQLQNIAIPAQVTVSVQQGGVSSGGTEAVTNPTYTISSPQSLARILAAATQSYTVRTGSQSAVGSVNVSTGQPQVQQSENSAAVAVSVPNLLSKVGTGCTVITLPVATATMAQRAVIGGGRQEAVALRLAPSLTSTQGQQQTLILESSTAAVQPGDVTRVHSYSLASASSTLTPSGGSVPQVGCISTNRVMVPLTQAQKGSPVTGHSCQTNLPQKRTANTSSISSVTSVNSGFGTTVANIASSVNNLTSLSTSGTAVISTGSPSLTTCIGSSIPSPFSSPKPKRVKLEEKPPANEELASKRKRICDHLFREFRLNKERYHQQIIELFFLQNGGNMMDYWPWRKRPSPQLIAFLRANALDSDDEEEQKTQIPSLLSSGSVYSSPDQGSNLNNEQLPQHRKSPVSNSSSSHSQLLLTSRLHTPSPISGPPKTTSLSPVSLQIASSPGPNVPKTIKQPQIISPQKLASRHHSISAVYDSTIGSQEEIVERAKQEAYVMQRIAELRKEGLWSLKRLPKVQEPPRTKAHWDYLLEEMVWLATDFAQERKWKKAAAKKCARMVMKYHQEKEMKAEKAEKEEQQKLRKIASQVAKEIKQFWANIEKLVEYKQQTWLEEKRKKALDLHLNFIVDQTEKYSSWLTQGMNRSYLESTGTSTASSPVRGSRQTSPERSHSNLSHDDEFKPEKSESDDEETIEKEEAEGVNEYEQNEEIKLLQEESEVPLEDLLKSLPPEILEKPASPLLSEGSEEETKNHLYAETDAKKTEEVVTDKTADTLDDGFVDDDDEFEVTNDDDDDEATILEQEKRERDADYEEELRDLQAENELPIEELYQKYAEAYASDFEIPESDDSISEVEAQLSPADEKGSSCDEKEEEVECENDSYDALDQVDVGMEYLISPHKENYQEEISVSEDNKNPSKEITDIAATAESFQPKGNTLSTTQVYTKIPFLLKHQLREYQHIGLDWLFAMHDKKLNGILADEMGLGKTIQTIALLAHLACDKGIWGPHLIVVPTSVMLNWEMEFKKWCPAFKILTYYGTPKERKQKRTGWTKPNAFHVCITSYKLVVQDHQSFRRKKWKYFILDEAQHIKNFKSQRWQMLLNFQSSHRLLLTGTPLQNSLMELWSLMHFLMPNVFQSHREFREWFVNPVTGMIEGSHEYNENLIKRLHKVLRPFLLRRLKCEVEKQLPKKYEHVIMCRLSKRQRYLYDDFMSQTKTKETLASGSFMSVINILMQLRKVCNHPNMFEGRPTVSPFMMEGLTFHTASVVWNVLDYDPFKHVSLWALNLLLADLELCLTAFAAHRIKKFQTPPCYIEEIDSQPEPPPRCPSGKIRLHIRTSTPAPGSGRSSPIASHPRTPSPAPAVRMSTSPVVTRLPSTAPGIVSPQRYMVMPGHHSAPSSRATSPVAAVGGHQVIGPTQSTEYTLQLLQQPSGGLPVAQLAPLGSQVVTSAPITVQIQQTVQGGARLSMPLGIGRLVQTSTGQHLLLTPTVSTVSTEPQQVVSAASTVAYTCITNTVASVPPIVVPGPAVGTATVLPQMQKIGSPTPMMSPIVAALNRPQMTTPVPSALTTQVSTNKPVGRVAPLNIHTQTNSSVSATPIQNAVQGVKPPVVHSLAKCFTKAETHTNSVTSEKRNSLFFMESLSLKREKVRKDGLHLLGLINVQRCAACPIYGRDLIEAVTVIDNVKPSSKSPRWGRGYVNCLNAPYIEKRPRSHWLYTKALSNIVTTPENCIQKLSNVINRFVFVIPAVAAPCIQLHVSHPPPSKKNAERQRIEKFTTYLSPRCALLHPIISNMRTQFPELRLIQYDCGKLQTLDKLLWQLKSGHHRVLIFTQMTRMLDILEQFLNYHGHTYLRLDGNTRVDQRQALMERFNADKRIFCFILSTRSGGIGVNLTGADTVIFYDSDWNPTMDAQAQDRCHRIGQTRDVHIYRLISERTIEENILKKANQKRILGDLAIEGGNFTTAFFKTNTIRELFGIDMQEENWFRMDADAKKIKEELDEKQTELLEKFSHAQLEQALGMAEEELDLQAAKTARAEAAAELAEFDESIPLDSDSRDNEEKSPAEEELEKLMEQLTPVEKYAMQFLESLQEPFSLEQLKLAEEEIEAQKKDWELGRLKALKEEEERRLGLLNSEEDPLLTYGRADAYNQVYLSVIGREEMPIWAPPTPPQDENDLYIDYSMGFLYEQSLMPESQLPPIYIKKEAKRLKVDPVVAAVATTRKQKVRKDETVHIPRSLFDRPTAAILKMRREAKLQKVKGLMVGSPVVSKPLGGLGPLKQTPVVVNKPTVDTHQDSPEWLVHEDWSVLQVIQTLQDLPLSLTVLSPAHIPNWDLVSDTVNSVSRIYRSPKQCKNRYESVVVPREEGKILYDTNPKKQKKTKGIYKTKNNRPMRTSQLYLQDNNSSFTGLYSNRFETIKAVANKRTPTLKPWFVSQTGKNPKHAAVLAESGISYEQPLTPVQVAVNRAERITREKQKNQAVAAAAAAAQAAEQQLAVQRQQQQQVQQQATVPVAGTTGLIQHQAQAVIASLSQAQQLQQATQLSKGALQAGAVTTVSLAKPLGSGIMVNTAAGSTASTFATISKALGQTGVATVSAQGSVQNATVAALNSATLRSQRPTVTTSGTTTTMTVQEMVAAAAAAGQVRGLTTASVTGSTSAAPAVVSVSGLTAVQLQAASQRISASSLAAATTVASGVSGTQAGTQVTTTRNMTQSQIQAFRQTALLRQQRLQEQQLKQQQQLKRLQVAAAAQQQASQQAVSGKVAVSVSSPLSASVAAVAAAAAAQQRAAQQQAAAKQSVGRGMTEAEVAQLLKRQQQLQQQKQAAVAAAQLTTAQILAQAQLQQVQQQQAAITGTVQTPVATLVKTVSAPTSLGGSPSVAIPVSAVTMAGVNINVSLPQGKTGSAPSKGTAAATVTQQQLRQLQLQHQLLQQQRKVQKVASLAQLAKVQGKSPTATTLPNQLSTVQIVQHGTQAGNQQQGKSLQTAAAAMTVQQIQQVIKQVLPQHIPVQVSSTQSTGGAPVTTSVSQNQLLSHHAVLQAASSVSGIKPAASVALAHTSPATITSTTSSTQTLASAISSNCSSLPVQTRVIPVSQTVTASVASTLATSQPTLKQTIQVVTATPSLTASLQPQQTLRGESGMVTGTIKPQTTTLPSTTLTTSAVLKGTPAVVVSGQPQTAAILQQVASSTAGLTPQQAVTLAVRAAAQAQGQPQVQIQVQQTPTSLVASQSQVVSAVQSTQAQIQQISTSPATATINLAQPLPIQSVAQTASVLAQPSGVAGLTSQVAVDSSQPSPTQVVMQSVTSSSPQPGATIALPSGVTPASTATAQVVQAAIQAAKQQQAAQQQQRASPYTMRLRNPPKQ